MRITFALLTLIISLNVLSAEKLEVVTSDYPPFQFQKGEVVTGMATEIVEGMLRLAKIEYTISMYPWPRAYQIAQTKPNTLIYSIVRLPKREDSLKWIGPIIPFRVFMWKLYQNKRVNPKNLAEAKQFSVGGVFDDYKATYLKEQGFIEGKNLEMVRNDELNILKLYGHHLDLMPFDDVGFAYKIKSAGHDPSRVKKLFELDGLSKEMYVAASLGTKEATIKSLQEALIAFKKTPEYKKISAKYLK